MNRFPLQIHIPKASRLIYGCMGLGGEWNSNPVTSEHYHQAHELIDTALEGGINFFDHADIYTMGKAEQVFGQVLKERPALRSDIIIQSKCGIRFEDAKGPGRYDLSPEWIKHSVDGILERLGTEYLDVLMMHRPDPLMEPELIADAFNELYASGKVRHFGVSNMNQHQIAYLYSCIEQPLIANQIPLSLRDNHFVEDSVLVGTEASAEVGFAQGLVDYSRKHRIQIQAWGCLAQGLYTGRHVTDEPEKVHNTIELVKTLAARYQTSPEAIVLGWLIRHPAGIQPVLGTTNIARLKGCIESERVKLSRDDWYKLYVSARGERLP